jgi:ABC-type sugar transport system ATPase subunit
MSQPVLQIENFTKRFGGVTAVKEVSLSISSGETIALLGENGAGKSTLMKSVSGVHAYGSYTGRILLDGSEVHFRGVRDAESKGVVLVPQELHVASNLSIAENVAMGALPNKWGVVDQRKLLQKARECLRFFEIDANPSRPASTLSASEQRLLIISAALAKASPKLLILDEPTAALTPGEAEHLYDKMRQVSNAGVPIIFITHRLDEIEGICSRAFVMRNGGLVYETTKIRGGRSDIVRAMIGHDPERPAPRVVNRGADALRLENLRVTGPIADSKAYVEDVSLKVAAGEIVGLFGLVGAGQTELAMAVYGAWQGKVDGKVTVNGLEGRPKSPREALRRGCAMMTEDRKWSGIFEGQNVLSNISAASIAKVTQMGVIRAFTERNRALGLARGVDLRPLALNKVVEAFSGGNQQKIVLSRWLAAEPNLLIIDEPTVGVDIGAREEIYRILRRLAEGGKAILMISSDIEEVINESDRIVVMYKGRVTGEFPAGASAHDLMAAATG